MFTNCPTFLQTFLSGRGEVLVVFNSSVYMHRSLLGKDKAFKWCILHAEQCHVSVTVATAIVNFCALFLCLQMADCGGMPQVDQVCISETVTLILQGGLDAA